MDLAWQINQPDLAAFVWIPANNTCIWASKANVVGCFQDGTGE